MVNYTIRRYRSPYPPATFQFCQPGFFFNNPEHLCQQSQQPFCTITALNQTTQLTEARCTFFVEAGQAVSPSAAPFGSIEFADSLPDTVLTGVVTALVDEARLTGSDTLQIVNYPHCYAPEQAERLTRQLLEQGFRVKENNPNAYFSVTNQSFDANLSPAERRRLRKCQRANFQFGHWTNPDPDTIVSFLADVHRQQNYRLPLSAVGLAGLLRQFPDEFQVFTVKDGFTIAALTIAIRVRNDILYSFLPASQADYRTFSPMVMLTNGLFTYCGQHGISLLDLGVSLDGNRQPKPSLMRFKRNLGARESPKLIFEKRL